MGPEHAVARSEMACHAHRDGLLADGQMAGTTDGAGRYHVADLLLRAPDEDHPAERVREPGAINVGEAKDLMMR
jgi:hypothetical protein